MKNGTKSLDWRTHGAVIYFGVNHMQELASALKVISNMFEMEEQTRDHGTESDVHSLAPHFTVVLGTDSNPFPGFGTTVKQFTIPKKK